MDNNYKAPVQDQASIGFAQQIGSRYSAQADFVHTAADHIQMSRSISFFEAPARNVPVNPGTVIVSGIVTANNRPYPQYLDITLCEIERARPL